ncbi:MAG: SDR family oxidoreductase [Acidobacteriota bacterium]|jgi:NADP-dependent 3-hydroxy acid dehydrogenase YdfG
MSRSEGSLEGKVALVTGGSKGIGRSTALKFAKSGARLAIAATREDLLEGVRKECEAYGVDILAVACDLSERSGCEALVEKVLEHFGEIGILVNNAGVGYSGKIADSDPGEVEQMVKVNILGIYHVTRCVLPAMIAKGEGDIVNIGSVAGIKYSPNFAVYSATKFAVRAFSEALRNEVQEHNIRLTVVHPGMTRTAFFESFSKGGSPVPVDQGDILSPDHIAETIHFAVTRPDGVALNEVTVRPTWQVR